MIIKQTPLCQTYTSTKWGNFISLAERYVHHRDTENAGMYFFVCREAVANENHQSRLQRDQRLLLLPRRGRLFLPIVVSRWAKKKKLCALCASVVKRIAHKIRDRIYGLEHLVTRHNKSKHGRDEKGCPATAGRKPDRQMAFPSSDNGTYVRPLWSSEWRYERHMITF